MTDARVLRVLVADDERPARSFLLGLLKTSGGVEIVGEAADGDEAASLIASRRPDLALLDLQMPELGGLDVARRLSDSREPPFVAFVTAFDDHAIEAFELNAIDYLLKPVQPERLQTTLSRVRERLRRGEAPEARAASLSNAAAALDRAVRRPFVERIPVRHGNDVLLVPVRQIASVIADGELLHITIHTGQRYTVTHRLHALEARLDPRRFIRLGRGTLANVDAIARISPLPGGTSVATLTNGQELPVSRIQSRILRETLLKL